MHWKSRLGHALELYAAVLAETASADGVVQRFFRNRRYLGSRDRRWIGEVVWALVRGRVRWRHFAQAVKAPAVMCKGPAEAFRDFATAWYAPGGFVEGRPDSADHETGEDAELTSELPEIARLHEMPEETINALCEWLPRIPVSYEGFLAGSAARDPEWRLGWPRERVRSLEKIAPAFASEGDLSIDDWITVQTKAMAETAPVALRVNTAKIDRTACAALLAEQGVATTPSPLSPYGLLAERRVNLDPLPVFKDGLIEVQDEGSQLVAPVIAAGRPSRVLDACAGAGGKSLHLASLLDQDCEIYASDRDQFRLTRLIQRARRAGTSQIRPMSMETAQTLDPLDAVLIDAPCSGLGTLRRSPDRLWKVGSGAAASYHRRQLKLLGQWAPFVRPTGLLVYVTCSFLPQENESVVTAFLEKHADFTVEDSLDAWRTQFGEDLAPSLTSGWLGHGRQLLPGVHGCDGFFISCLRRKSA